MSSPLRLTFLSKISPMERASYPGRLEVGLGPGGQKGGEDGIHLLGVDKKNIRTSSIMVLGKWVSDSGDSRLAKTEVQAATGEHPVALGPSGHWDSHVSDNVPSAHCPCFRSQWMPTVPKP